MNKCTFKDCNEYAVITKCLCVTHRPIVEDFGGDRATAEKFVAGGCETCHSKNFGIQGPVVFYHNDGTPKMVLCSSCYDLIELVPDLGWAFRVLAAAVATGHFSMSEEALHGAATDALDAYVSIGKAGAEKSNARLDEHIAQRLSQV